MPQYQFTEEFKNNLKETAKLMKKDNVRKILVQIPNGLRDITDKIVDLLEEEGFEVYIWGGSNWGACDLPTHFKIDAFFDALLHIGHLKFYKNEFYLQKE